MNTLISQLAFKAKALALNVTETELKVLEATNEAAWGPHGKDMQGKGRLHCSHLLFSFYISITLLFSS